MINNLLDDVEELDLDDWDEATFEELDDLMASYDASAAMGLSTAERNVVYAVTSVGRHSARFWAEAGGALASGDPGQEIISADMEGAFKGFLTMNPSTSFWNKVKHVGKEMIMDSVFTGMRLLLEHLVWGG